MARSVSGFKALALLAVCCRPPAVSALNRDHPLVKTINNDQCARLPSGVSPDQPEDNSNNGLRQLKELNSGEPVIGYLCAGWWKHFIVNTRNVPTKSIPMRQREMGTNGLFSTVVVDTPAEVDHVAVSVSLDTVWQFGWERFDTVDIFVTNVSQAFGTGEPSNPDESGLPGAFTIADVNDILNEDYFSATGPLPYTAATSGFKLHAKKIAADSATLTLGYNETNVDEGDCLTPLDKVVVSIRCRYTKEFTDGPDPTFQGKSDCVYQIQADLLPRQLGDGHNVVSALGPRQWHFFYVNVGTYDILNITLERIGNNLTYFDHQTGELDTNGHGLIGAVMTQKSDCPSLNSFEREVKITNMTVTANIMYFCTEPLQEGTYWIGIYCDSPYEYYNYPVHPPVETDTDTRIIPEKSNANQILGGGGTDVYAGGLKKVNEARIPITDSQIVGEIQPLDNLGYGANELQAGRGSYNLTIRHIGYSAVDVESRESRPACVSWGQWRYFKIDTTDISDASIYVRINGRVSGMYLRQDDEPNYRAYDGLAQTGQMEIGLSSCNVYREGSWYVGINLVSEQEATQATTSTGVAPTEFDIYIELESALVPAGHVLDLTDTNGENAGELVVTPKSDGGDGYVCCGNFKYYLVENIPDDKSLQIEMNVTKGKLRALYAKYDTCPTFAEDVIGDKCTGYCEMKWYTVFDTYNGDILYHTDDQVLVPFGLDGTADLRQSGTWWIGVQALEFSAEYQFRTRLVEPPPRPDVFTCDKFDKLCPSPDSFNVPEGGVLSSGHRCQRQSLYGIIVALAMHRAWHFLL